MGKYIDVMRMKWLAEDCSTLKEVIDALEQRKQFVQELIDFGCEIVENSDDYIFFEVPEDKVDEYCEKFNIDKFNLCDEEEVELQTWNMKN